MSSSRQTWGRSSGGRRRPEAVFTRSLAPELGTQAPIPRMISDQPVESPKLQQRRSVQRSQSLSKTQSADLDSLSAALEALEKTEYLEALQVFDALDAIAQQWVTPPAAQGIAGNSQPGSPSPSPTGTASAPKLEDVFQGTEWKSLTLIEIAEEIEAAAAFDALAVLANEPGPQPRVRPPEVLPTVQLQTAEVPVPGGRVIAQPIPTNAAIAAPQPSLSAPVPPVVDPEPSLSAPAPPVVEPEPVVFASAPPVADPEPSVSAPAPVPPPPMPLAQPVQPPHPAALSEPPTQMPTLIPVSLNGLQGTATLTGRVDTHADIHSYSFSLEQTSDFNLILEGLSAHADVQLLDADGKLLYQSNAGNLSAELINATLPAGDYQVNIQVPLDGNGSGPTARTTEGATDYKLVLSAVPDGSGTSNNLEVTSATYLGGLGNDTASAIELSPQRELVVAGNFSAAPNTVSQRFLLGAATESAGQIVRMSLSGQEILSITHLGNEINDMDVNRENGTIAAGGDFGITLLNAAADQVLWSQKLDGEVRRVAIANDGKVVTLHDKTVTVWSATGTQLAQTTLSRSFVEDIAIHPTTGAIYAVGFDNKYNSLDQNPVQVAYMTAFDSQLNVNWQTWGYDADTLTHGQNDMADTRGYRVTIGRDGELYFLGEVAGGNSVFRWNGKDRSTNTLVKYDAYNDPYNSASPHQTYYARIDPATGEVVQGQLAIARLANGAANAVRVIDGSIAADEQGNVYIGGRSFAGIDDRNLQQVGGQTVGDYAKGDPFALVISSDFRTRRSWTPFTENGGQGTISGFAVGEGRAAVLGTVDQGSLITKAALNDRPFNPDDPNTKDVYLATWGTDTESEFASYQYGTTGNDVLSGGKTEDVFWGEMGQDVMKGGGGADVFAYFKGGDGGDRITDFSADDQLSFSALGFGGGLQAGVELVIGQAASTGTFVLGSQPLGSSANFLYSQGKLWFDGDGTGPQEAIEIASFDGAPSLEVSQIKIAA